MGPLNYFFHTVSCPLITLQAHGSGVYATLKFDTLMSWVCVVLCRGGTEETTGRDQCGLPAAGAGEGAEQEDRPGAEDERGGQVQVRHADRHRAENLEKNR